VQKTTDTIIIGGGLTGLLIAYLLQKEGISSEILEARHRLGGRIYTLRSDDGSRIEMGATWLGKKHHHLIRLLDDLEVDITEQYMGSKGYYEPISVSPPQLVDLPPIAEPSYRIAGGSDTLIQTLANRLDQGQVHLDQTVKTIRKTGKLVEVQTESDLFKTDFVISTLPPKLLVENVDVQPSLPEEFVDIASLTHTWMAESIKVALTFEEPFWRNPDCSGTIFSNVGPIGEMYDHSGDNHYALKGFMNSAYQAVSAEQRKELIIDQLCRFYGDKADSYLTYRELVWQNEPHTYSRFEQTVIPHQYNGHAIFQKPLLEERLFITGAETATAFPGYMDGAVESALRTVGQIKSLVNTSHL